jgi:hypothetical protein
LSVGDVPLFAGGPAGPDAVPDAGTRLSALRSVCNGRETGSKKTKMKVYPTMLLKTNGNFCHPTMFIIIKGLLTVSHDLYENKPSYPGRQMLDGP